MQYWVGIKQSLLMNTRKVSNNVPCINIESRVGNKVVFEHELIHIFQD